MVNSFQLLTSAVKSSIPDASDTFSDASQMLQMLCKELSDSVSTSASQILLRKHVLIYVNHMKNTRIYPCSWVNIDKKKTNQTKSCNLEVISATPGYVRFMTLIQLYV